MTNKYRYIPDLASDMAECDANYLRLRRLFPAMDQQDEFTFGMPAHTLEGARVQIRVLSRARYTTALAVEVSSQEGQPFIRWPRLKVHIYLDVKSAEVVQFERHRNFRYRYQTPNRHMFAPDEKSQVNRFLGELLTHCLEYGHSLEPVTFT